MPAKPVDAQEELRGGDFYLSLYIEPDEFACNDLDDPADYIHETKGRIRLTGFSGEVLAEIGTFAVIQVDADGLLTQGLSIPTAFDITQETWDYYEELFDQDVGGFSSSALHALGIQDDLVPWGLLIISDVVIFPEYRRKDFGLLAVKTLIQRFRMGVGVVAMSPFPDQHRGEFTPEQLKDLGLDMYRGGEKACTLRLRAHFSQLGFRLVPQTTVMGLSPVRRLDNLPLTTSVIDGC